MSYSGRNFDIVTGIAALLVAALLASGCGGRTLAAAWNILGLALLLNVDLPKQGPGYLALGQIEPGIYASVACNGANVAKGTMAGKLLADHACGIESPAIQDQLKMPWPAFIPPHPLLALFAIRRMARMMGGNTAER